MSQITILKCMNCYAPLPVFVSGQAKCSYCGTNYILDRKPVIPEVYMDLSNVVGTSGMMGYRQSVKYQIIDYGQ